MRGTTATSGSHRRRGSAYILVLTMTMLVTVVGMSVLTFARLKGREIVWTNNTKEASVLAQAAVELALTKLSANSNWRTTYTHGVETAPVALGSGTISFKLVDEADGDLANAPSDPVRIYGIGRAGAATRIYSQQAYGSEALTCLNAALTANGDMNLTGTGISAPGNTVASNGSIHCGNASVNANLEAVGIIYPEQAQLQGTQTSGVAARTIPGPGVFDYYISSGTQIPIGALPLNKDSSPCVTNVLISPASNPYGSETNAEGIYVIRCQNQSVVIEDCRIVGTLVLLDSGPNSQVGAKGVNWVAAVSNYPCLLVRGNIILGFSNDVRESTAGVNYNPSGTPYPYPYGTTNTTTTDAYPSIVAGLVYVSGNIPGGGSWPAINMLVVGGTCGPAGSVLTLSYNSIYVLNPPPGFAGGGTLAPVPGSWRWEKVP